MRQGVQDGVPTRGEQAVDGPGLGGLMAAGWDAGADGLVERELEAGQEARSPHWRLDKRAGLGDYAGGCGWTAATTSTAWDSGKAGAGMVAVSSTVGDLLIAANEYVPRRIDNGCLCELTATNRIEPRWRGTPGGEGTLLAAPVAACMVLLISIHRSVCRRG